MSALAAFAAGTVFGVIGYLVSATIWPKLGFGGLVVAREVVEELKELVEKLRELIEKLRD